MYLFIFESIGAQELILIGIVALIVFGPRKLPDLARTIGKTMADFRKVTDEFKSTWEKEVEEDKKMLKTFAEDPLKEENSISNFSVAEEDKKLLTPQVKELNPAEIEKIFQNKEFQSKEAQADLAKIEEPQTEPPTLSKRDWL